MARLGGKMRKSLIWRARNGLQSRLRRFDSDPSLQLPPGQSRKSSVFSLEQAVSQHSPRTSKGLETARLIESGWRLPPRFRPTIRFSIWPGTHHYTPASTPSRRCRCPFLSDPVMRENLRAACQTQPSSQADLSHLRRSRGCPSVPAYRRWRRLIGARPRHGCSVPSAVHCSRSRNMEGVWQWPK